MILVVSIIITIRVCDRFRVFIPCERQGGGVGGEGPVACYRSGATFIVDNDTTIPRLVLED